MQFRLPAAGISVMHKHLRIPLQFNCSNLNRDRKSMNTKSINTALMPSPLSPPLAHTWPSTRMKRTPLPG